ncbi:hypothetical protein B7486_08640 [cyanobacterium TDX16]|nr:hypothetical protein B7486_08640 [cyanobacterium TDX16]
MTLARIIAVDRRRNEADTRSVNPLEGQPILHSPARTLMCHANPTPHARELRIPRRGPNGPP